MDFDLSVYAQAMVAGVPLLFPVLGLVTLYGKLGVKGKWQLVGSMLTGLVLGVLFMVAQTRPPSGDWYAVYGYWFSNVVYGLGLGLIASGVYETFKAGAIKAFLAAAEKLYGRPIE